ncbi:hypothetical protein VMCG_02567 [Cytospora schulzeri]|uniref:Uncharacterized protein n=1 Tax=Cytospora schulzeri TaxID=448051 RepID=A0A423X0K0_9PEZI|nr:hypothetical protein VMCG_02567 [Valsa malicola]
MVFEFQFPGSNHNLVTLETPVNSSIVKPPKRSKPNTGSVAGMCNRTTGLMSVAVATFCRCGAQRRKVRRTARTDTPGDLEDRAFGMNENISMSRFGHVLSRFRQRRRKLNGQEVKEVSWETHPKEAPLVDLSSHWFPSVYGIQEFGTNWAQTRPYEEPRPTMESQPYGPVPAYTLSMGKAEWDTNLVGHYGPADTSYPVSGPPLEITSEMPSMPSPTMPHHSDRQNRRCGLPSPLIIVPPPTTSISIARGQSDTTSTAAYPPYSPYDYYPPHIDSPVPSLSPNDDVAPNFTYGPRPTHSSNSNRSSPQPRSPISRQSTGTAPSMSRSTSSGQTEPRSLPPPTPTYLQSQRAPIDSDNIICLGPLPDNISPKNLQFQPQKPRPTPRAAITTPNEKHHHNSPIWPAANSIGPIQQDPLLHDSSPPPAYHQGPAAVQVAVVPITLTRDRDRSPRRRSSTDSLGSNFTVEEEARIQEQVVRNLSMLGQERVGGEGDMVHIPQPSARRFSFED